MDLAAVAAAYPLTGAADVDTVAEMSYTCMVLGDAAVGKTQWIRALAGEAYAKAYVPTPAAADTQYSMADGHTATPNLHYDVGFLMREVPGSADPSAAAQAAHYAASDCAVVLISATNGQSQAGALAWLAAYRAANATAPAMFVMNKTWLVRDTGLHIAAELTAAAAADPVATDGHISFIDVRGADSVAEPLDHLWHMLLAQI